MSHEPKGEFECEAAYLCRVGCPEDENREVARDKLRALGHDHADVEIMLDAPGSPFAVEVVPEPESEAEHEDGGFHGSMPQAEPDPKSEPEPAADNGAVV